MKTWLEPDLVTVPNDFQRAVGGHLLVSEILVRRGFSDLDSVRAFLDLEKYTPTSPYALSGMEKAVERLSEAIQQDQSICVWGDFDVDGQTATTLLISTLKDLGGIVEFHIPIREVESHGINLPVLRQKIESGIDLLLTCDTGISAHEAVEFANSRGVDVIITDHHDPLLSLPDALAVINPKLGLPDHPLIGLPGVGVAYKLAEALYDHLGGTDRAESYLDLVALGIVADLALQVWDVRYLLQRGLEALRETKRLGLQKMMELAEINPAGLTEEHIGFELGPRLNALGRLSDANMAVELLTTTDPGRARILANRLEGLNERRKYDTEQVFRAALAQLDGDPSLLGQAALVLSHPAWPSGVIGIVASRLVERYARPVAMIASPAGELARGSARSIPGVNITAAIAAQQQMLVSFGGHPMAAGFALQPKRIPDFRQALSETVAEMMDEAQIEPSLPIDGFLPLANLSLELVSDLERLAPFGTGNPNLVLVGRGFNYEHHKSLGRTGEHLQLRVADEQGESHNTIWWGGGIVPLPDWLIKGAVFDLAYSVRSRDYRGQQEVQIEWLEARPVECPVLEVFTEGPAVQIKDYRREEHPLAILKKLLEAEDVHVWAEASARDKLAEIGISSQDRNNLVPHAKLVIWTTPPGADELRNALERVSPKVLYLFAVDPGMDRMDTFLERLSGLIKYALRRNGGHARISALAGATAQRKIVVEAGLEWLTARGIVEVLSEENDEIHLAEGDQLEMDGLVHKSEKLQGLIDETAAYRKYFTRAEVEQLIVTTLKK